MAQVTPAVAERWASLKNVPLLGHVTQSLSIGYEALSLVHHCLWEQFGERFEEEVLWAVVRPTYDNLMTASMKFDSPQDFSFMERSEVQRSLTIIQRYYEPLWTCGVTGWQEVFADVDWDTAAGLPYSLHGLQKKGHVLSFPDEFVQHMTDSVICKVRVVFKTSPKIEFLKISDITAHKIRLFNPAGVHFVCVGKRLYLKQNKRAYRTRWIKLGINMHSGGAHRLTKELEPPGAGWFVLELDIPRCDKNHKLMRWIYQLRNRCLQTSDTFDGLAKDWYASNISYLHVALFDGAVIGTGTANPSGQPNTADDNCPWCLLLVLTMASLACPTATNAELNALTLHVYSDDFRGLFPPKFKKLRDTAWFVNTCYSVFQVAFKEEDLHFYQSPDGSHFLGADTVLYGNMYLPLYDRDRLYAAFQYQEAKHAPGVEMQRLRSLLIMAWPHPDLYLKFERIYARLLFELRKSTDPAVMMVVSLGLPSKNMLRRAFLGLEGI